MFGMWQNKGPIQICCHCPGKSCCRTLLKVPFFSVDSSKLLRHGMTHITFNRCVTSLLNSDEQMYVTHICKTITRFLYFKFYLQIVYWDVFDGSAIREVEGSKSGAINGMTMSQDGRHFVTGNDLFHICSLLCWCIQPLLMTIPLVELKISESKRNLLGRWVIDIWILTVYLFLGCPPCVFKCILLKKG